MTVARRSVLLMALFLCLGSLLAAPETRTEEASLERKIGELLHRYENGSKEPKDFSIDEREANTYLRAKGAAGLPEGIESPWVRFEKDLTITGATLDLEQVRSELPDSMFFRLLTGRVPVEVTARVSGADGTGTIELERVVMAGVELPRSLIDMLIERYDTSRVLPEGFRLGEPFPLPYDLESIRCRPKAVHVRQRATAGND